MRSRIGIFQLLLRAALLCAAMICAGAPAAGARTDPAPDPASGAEDPSLPAVLTRISAAWLARDHVALAALAAPDGVELSLASQIGEARECSAGQAHYYFKNLFRNVENVSFDILRIGAPGAAEDDSSAAADGVGAVATWRFRRGGPELVEHLFLELVRYPDGWRWTEIRVRP